MFYYQIIQKNSSKIAIEVKELNTEIRRQLAR